MDRLPVKARS